MQPPNDPHGARFDDARLENLVLLAFGEPAENWFDEHRITCPDCQRELDELSATVRLGREVTALRGERMPAPPDTVWDAIARELDFAVEPIPVPVAAPAPPIRPSTRPSLPARRWRLGLAAAAIVVALLAAAGTGLAIGRHESRPAVAVFSHAQLAAVKDGPSAVHGTAAVHRAGTHLTLAVSTDGLPLRQGYYQVWLFDPAANRMVPIGALGTDGTGTFTLPDGVDLRSYDIIDVSAQDYDTNNGELVHKQSVLQGPLTQ